LAGGARRRVTTIFGRWRKEEGNYRDDITAIVTHLPFLETDEEAASADDVHFDVDATYINFQAPGISKMQSGDMSPDPMRKGAPASTAPKESDDDGNEGFARRRLSITNPFGDGDAEWEEAGDDVEV